MSVRSRPLTEEKNNRWDAELPEGRKRRCKAPAKIQNLPEELNKQTTDGTSCISIFSVASSLLVIHEVGTAIQMGFGVLKGSPWLQEIFLLCCLGNFLWAFCIFHFSSPLLYNTFSTGTTNPFIVLSQLWKMETHLHALSRDARSRNKTLTQLIQTPGCYIHGTLWAVKGTMNQVQRVIAGFTIIEGKFISKPEVWN